MSDIVERLNDPSIAGPELERLAYDAADEIERLTAEIVALKYSIKLITGMVPIDIHKYVAALEAYGVEVDDE